MKRPLAILIVFATLAIVAASSLAGDFKIEVEEFKLDNGMTFLVVQRPMAPVFAGYIGVQVGSAYEKIGNIGSAHLLEHMMFKGSQNVGTTNYVAERALMVQEDSVWQLIDSASQELPYLTVNNPELVAAANAHIEALRKTLDSLSGESSQYVVQNEFDGIYTANGSAQFNASTGYDYTDYYVSLPANRLELWFNLESDRLLKPAFREFFPERDVVSEERRLSVENNSDSKLFEQFIGTAFIAHPYQLFWEWQSEVHALTRADMEHFFKTYYVPSRMVAAVVGDVQLEEVKQLAEKYFGRLPKGTRPEPIYAREPEQRGERRVEVIYEASPAVFVGYHKTAFDHPDEPAFHVLQSILADGRTSRLYQTLVLEDELCLDISADVFPGGTLGDMHAGLFCIYAYPKEGVTTSQVEEGIYRVLDKVATELVTAEELAKVKKRLKADYIWSAYSNMGLAGRLAMAHTLARDWRYGLTLSDRMETVTAEQIRDVASRYLIKSNRTVATLVPKEEEVTQ